MPAEGREGEEAPPRRGAAEIGAIYLQTQQHRAESLSVQLAYDDLDHRYAPASGFTVTVQNAWRPAPRRPVAATWTLTDREGDSVARGRRELDLSATESTVFRVELDALAETIASRSGPFRFTDTASEIEGAATAEAVLVLARPDSGTVIADFEADRGFPGLRAHGAPDPATPAARTGTDHARSGSRALAMRWERDKPLFVTVDPPLPGIPTDVSMWVHGDGSGVLFYPLIGDRYGVVSGVREAQWNLFLPRTVDGPLQNAVRVDWTGWRELTFRLPPIPASWADELPVRPFVPNYPFAIHLAAVADRGVEADSGTLYVDDVAVRTHVAPEQRLAMRLERDGESNVALPGNDVVVTLANLEWPGPGIEPRRVRLSGGLYDWTRGRVAGLDRDITLAPGAREAIRIATEVPTGAYRVRVSLDADGAAMGGVDEDLVVMDAVTVIGPDWNTALADSDRLRAVIDNRYFPFAYDWDWVEHQRGNLLIDTLLDLLHGFRNRGLSPHVLLGYSAYWAVGDGYRRVQEGRMPSRWGHTGTGVRNWGSVADIFHVPEDMDDWDNYMRDLMRGAAGGPVAGWLLWDSPDSTTSLGVDPGVFADMLRRARHWRDRYCPEIPLIAGGLSRNTAIGYLDRIDGHGALGDLDGVNLRIDAGRITPEDGQILEYVEDLMRALETGPDTADRPARRILVSDLDWAVEREGQGLDAFHQAAYLSRAGLLLDAVGAEHILLLQNEDMTRLGLGLIYRETVELPPMRELHPAYRLKPAWWAMARLRGLLAELGRPRELEVQDRFPGLTRLTLYTREADGAPVAFIWRNGRPGQIAFTDSGYTVRSAEGLMGERLEPDAAGAYPIGDMPAVFVLEDTGEGNAARVRVRDAGTETWPIIPLAAFDFDEADAEARARVHTATGGESAVFEGRDWLGRYRRLSGLRFEAAGSERLRLTVPAGQALILRKRYFLDEGGQLARVSVGGREHGTWNLVRSQLELASGVRDAVYRIEPDAIDDGEVEVELRYESPANTLGWWALTEPGNAMPLTRLGPLHADSSVATPRVARNIAGQPLRVGGETFADGIGVFARSFLEYPLNGQFARFTAQVGIDAVTEGRGSVEFEIWADGEKRWSSGLMTGLDTTRSVELDITGIDRLRLLVDDGGDGNRYDVANWCDAVLTVGE